MNDPLETDFQEAGSGPTVVLIHSSVAGARQWRCLMDDLSNRYRLLAINLFGYGKTRAWPEDRVQTLEDQARLLVPLLPADGSKISIVGHSFGGSVAMKAAALLGERVERLVLIEPNPFHLLKEHGRDAAFEEILTLRATIKKTASDDSWPQAAEIFADYWTGDGSWAAMPDDRKAKFIMALKPNFHEWDSVMNERTSLAEWKRQLPTATTVITAADTVRSIKEIASLMQDHIPDWQYQEIDRGGHMAAMTAPDLVNPVIEQALR